MSTPQKKGIFVAPDGKNYAVTFALVTTLFLLWGFCNGMIDILNKHFQTTMSLNKMQSAFVQFANYMGYFLMALPAGWLARRYGYKIGILTGLGFIAAGALWFIPAIQINQYWAFLTGLFILAIGLATLETIANPYATVLGNSKYDATRINMAQTCNGVGWILGPVVGGSFVSAGSGAAANAASTGNESLFIPYMGVAVVVGILLAIFFFANVPDLNTPDEYVNEHGTAEPVHIWRHPHFVAAVLAQFLYCSAQTGVFAFFINYLHSEIPPLSAQLAGWLPSAWTVAVDGGFAISDKGAGPILGYGGFGLFLLGRFVGSAILSVAPAHRTLGAYAIINVVLMAIIIMKLGWLSLIALFLSFFFMSIMFPTIFALGIHGLGAESKKASSFIVMAIVGGAIIPLIMGHIADIYSMSLGFIVPLICFAYIALYGLLWPKLSRSGGSVSVGPAAH
jgi:FHS family L-fucose permease-like MFS transporter